MTEHQYRCEYVDPETGELCDKPLDYAGRGRPPKRCAEHKNAKSARDQDDAKPKEEKVPEAPRARPRPKPGSFTPPTDEPEKATPKDESKPPEHPPLPPVGKMDTKSRAKAEANGKRAAEHISQIESVPLSPSGKPLAKVTMTASELIPTGQYANVSVGPAQITAYIDLDQVSSNGSFFTDEQKENMAKALNELAEVVERDVIGVQRNLVLESMQEQLASDAS